MSKTQGIIVEILSNLQLRGIKYIIVTQCSLFIMYICRCAEKLPCGTVAVLVSQTDITQSPLVALPICS